jgi:hypothetical protein
MMKFLASVWTYIKRKWWYLLLLILSSIYVWHCRYEIYDMSILNAGVVIFILWLVLLLLPLFSEMEFFGIKLKKEVDKVKAEIKEGLSDIKMQMLDLKINTSFANNIQIGSTQPLASEKELEDLKQEVLKLRKQNNYTESKNVDYGVSKQTIQLFQTRLALEKVLREICERTDCRTNLSCGAMLRELSKRELIHGKLLDLTQQIISITNRGIHGEIVSEEYIDFVNTAFPDVYYKFSQLLNDLNHNICPRCKTRNVSQFENACPECGYNYYND